MTRDISAVRQDIATLQGGTQTLRNDPATQNHSQVAITKDQHQATLVGGIDQVNADRAYYS